MMSSTSWRSLMEGYYKGKFCFICLQMHDIPNKKPPFKCSLCRATYHHSCHESVFGNDSNSQCCSPSIDCKESIRCTFCLRKSGLLAPSGKMEAFHIECAFNDKLIINKRFVQETKGKVCNSCGSWRGTIFECGHPASSLCNQAFHLTCHQNLLLSMPLTLERLFSGGPISLMCSMHQPEEHKSLMVLHTQHLRWLSSRLNDEAKEIFRFEDHTISQIQEEPIRTQDLSLQDLLEVFKNSQSPRRTQEMTRKYSVSAALDEAEALDRTGRSKLQVSPEIPPPHLMLTPLGTSLPRRSRTPQPQTPPTAMLQHRLPLSLATAPTKPSKQHPLLATLTHPHSDQQHYYLQYSTTLHRPSDTSPETANEATTQTQKDSVDREKRLENILFALDELVFGRGRETRLFVN